VTRVQQDRHSQVAAHNLNGKLAVQIDVGKKAHSQIVIVIATSIVPRIVAQFVVRIVSKALNAANSDNDAREVASSRNLRNILRR